MDSASAEAKRLLAFIERIEQLESEEKKTRDDKKDVYSEASVVGYDAKIIRKIVAIRKQDKNKRREEEEILDLYMASLGMVD